MTDEEKKNMAEIEKYQKVKWYTEGVKLKAG